MARIAPGTAVPNQTSIDDLLANATRAASDADATAPVGERSSRRRPAAGGAILDQPASPVLGARPHAGPDARALCSELLKWEGYRREMYVDTRGHVTTGIGHLLPNANAALALPWKHKATGWAATPAEIRTAFEQVTAQAAGHAAPAFQRASDLVLPAGFAFELATGRLEREFLPGLRRLCPGFDGYPLPAQRALVDMAYNLGLGGLNKFHNLVAACERGDFRTAAEHCHRRTSRATRNEATRNLFLEAANLTASVRTLIREVRS